MESLGQFLFYLREPGGVSAAVGIALSILAEYWSGYQSLKPKMKRLAMFGLCMAIPLVAAFLSALMGYETAGWDSLIWSAVMAGFTAFSGGQIVHTTILNASKE